MEEIGKRIAMLRKNKGMTQEELAAIIGVSGQSVSKWETGATMPDILLLPVLADVFAIRIDDLFGQKGEVDKEIYSFDKVADTAHDALLDCLRHTWMAYQADGQSYDDYTQQLKQYFKDYPDSQTAIFSDTGGAVYANRDIGIVFKAAPTTCRKLLESEDAAQLLTALSDEAFRKILLYQGQDAGKSYTLSSVARLCGLDETDARRAVGLLQKYSLVVEHTLDMKDRAISVYTSNGGHKMLLLYTILLLAQRLADYHEHYRGFRGAPERWGC